MSDRSAGSSIGKFRHKAVGIAKFQLIALIVIGASVLLWVLGIAIKERWDGIV
jgi:hypothetical protein